jgi:glycosyltransferase involved in cell wall biosynthesis
LLVVPSRTDNLPTVVLEAFSTYTPVIGANTGGIPDMIEDGYNGILFEKENVNDLVVKLEHLLTNEELRKRIGENARRTFLEHFCTDNLPQRFEKLLAGTIT